MPHPDANPFAANRRCFLRGGATALGAAALAGLSPVRSAVASGARSASSDAALHTNAAAKAKRVIYLFQSGGPSQQDLFDYKPLLNKLNGQELPDSVRGGQRLTGMSTNQSSLPLAGSRFKFAQHGESGAWLSELLPHHAKIVDDVCFVRSLYTEAINHDPAITMMQTGSQIAGRPSFGAWLSYGIGSENADLPAFIVLVSSGQGGQPLYARLWGSGFLDSRHQGVRFRSGQEPVLYLTNPDGVCRSRRRGQLDAINQLNQLQHAAEGDPEITSRIAQYEMAFQMQMSVPEATDLSDEPESTFELYGEDARRPGTFAANCLLARRLAERDVRFIQLYHQGWDQHSNLPKDIVGQAKETDQASAALVLDLKQRGLLEDTLVVWAGEFGRTSYSQGILTADNYGRDHHPRCFTGWIAGGGFQPGLTYGASDDFGYNLASGGVHVHDLNATLLNQLGIDHERLTFKHQGRRFRLTDVHGNVVRELLS
ncbi:hypothetical protein Pla123a_14010 [Posidoniimonas polymericola]|uniref:Sulfatase n=1 Tax=Posidoniimonas polymericola TaxID=2528002 RepID=A0A5C5YRS5_9BACT|nr:DUF1501 domain-containing protein [Posidoniimonas polymericola]TWT77605.1 hypothetical protein Pla123a_14010 [Posidoniimonas polymericola]